MDPASLAQIYLDLLDTQNAVFYAQINHSLHSSDESLLLLVRCCYVALDYLSVFNLLLDNHAQKTIFYFAHSAIKLGKLNHAEIALECYKMLPNVLLLLAEIAKKTSRHNRAITLYKSVIAIDKHNYIAFKLLAEMGEPVSPMPGIMGTIVNAHIEIHNKYNYKQAIPMLNSLPSPLKNSSLVKLIIARAYFESDSWKLAAQEYKEIYATEPWSLKSMDFYSTSLWFLNRDVELSYLSQSLLELDKLNPQAWCTVGNSFSLKKDHEAAIKCFRRAIQLDPYYAYPHILSGHESLSMEDPETALVSFRNALKIDPNNYKAWSGLGSVYYKQDRFEDAETHYTHAIKCRPDPKLYCFKAIIAEKLQRYDQAMEFFSRAIGTTRPYEQHDSSNIWLFYQRAQVLLSTLIYKVLFRMERYQECLDQLIEIQDMVREPNIPFLMGRTYKKLGRIGEAIAAFSSAQDINFDVKGAKMIKEALDHITDGEDVSGDGFLVMYDV